MRTDGVAQCIFRHGDALQEIAVDNGCQNTYMHCGRCAWKRTRAFTDMGNPLEKN